LVPEILESVPGLVEETVTPLRANLPSGRAGGLLQFDSQAAGVPAEHQRTAQSPVAIAAWRHFLETSWSEDGAEIIDPYEATGTPHL
jgi:hypothetical protein